MAFEKMNTKKKDINDFSLLERILETQKDTKLASILALDLIMVGIDTVRIYSYSFYTST